MNHMCCRPPPLTHVHSLCHICLLTPRPRRQRHRSRKTTGEPDDIWPPVTDLSASQNWVMTPCEHVLESLLQRKQRWQTSSDLFLPGENTHSTSFQFKHSFSCSDGSKVFWLYYVSNGGKAHVLTNLQTVKHFFFRLEENDHISIIIACLWYSERAFWNLCLTCQIESLRLHLLSVNPATDALT